MERHRTIIIGGGLAGLSTARHLREESLVLEAAAQPGGLCVSRCVRGYTFDQTGHWLHLRDPELRRMAGIPLPATERRSGILSHGRLTDYPFQANLRGLPETVIVECLTAAVEAHLEGARAGERPPPRDFAEHVLRHFGAGIARHFMFPYNQKLWGVPPSSISDAWCQRFVPVPDLKQIIVGAFSDENRSMGYNASFHYPEAGGIGAFTASLAASVPGIRCDAEVVAVHGGEAWLELRNGERLAFDRLVSTMPLDALVAAWIDAPPEVREAASRLRCTGVDSLDLGVAAKVLGGQHWLYLPDPGLSIYRLGCYSNARPSMAPPGCSSLYVELRNDREVATEEALDHALEVLSAVGPTVGRADVEVCERRRISHGYVIYDHAYPLARSTVLTALAARGIRSTGRYGGWVYASMEDALLDGRAAARVLEED
ncbi:MAG: FAD-dependent oxidoreductase [Deltaproteobacteria bacterium]|nr:FAD-dependent oxidoreductase [Deltaproteobacteria bacterium]